MFSDIEYEVHDPVAVIRLNRPERLNAFTDHTLAELRCAVEDAMADPAVFGTIITGNGRGFCSGLDSDSLTAASAAGSGGRAPVAPGELHGLFSYFYQQPKPIIAAVNGVAAGGGMIMTSMADLRFASTEARFTTVFSKRGLIAEHGTSWVLPRLLGPGRALDLLWSSRMVDAEEALRIGMVEFVHEPDELLGAARAYLVDLADNVSAAAVRDNKALVYRHLGLGYPEALAEADDATYAALDRADSTEGAAALAEKRSPRFPRLGQDG